MKALPWVVSVIISVTIFISGCSKNKENREFKNKVEKQTYNALEVINDDTIVTTYPAGSWDTNEYPEWAQEAINTLNKYTITVKITPSKEHVSNLDEYKNKVDSGIYEFCKQFEVGFYSTCPKKAHFEWDITRIE